MDADAITDQTGVEVTRRVGDGDHIMLGDCRLEVVRITGHTPGSIVIAYDDRNSGGTWHLFTGDSLFPGGPGRTTSPQAFAMIMDDLQAKIFGHYPDDTWFYPGHGNDSTLGAERPSIPEWLDRGW